MDSARVIALLDELQFKYEREELEPELHSYKVQVDEEDQLEVLLLHYRVEDLEQLRLMLFVDELDKENPLDQLRLLMALNGELPAGAFCMDPDDEVIYATVGLSLSNVAADDLSADIELLIMALDIYDEEMNPPEAEG